MLLLAVLLVYCTIAVGIDPESGGLVQRLISQREELVQVHDRHHHHHNHHDHDCVHDHDHACVHDHDQAGLSYTNSSSPLLMPMTLADVQRLAHTSQVMMMTIMMMKNVTMMVMTWPVLASVVIIMLLRNIFKSWECWHLSCKIIIKT